MKQSKTQVKAKTVTSLSNSKLLDKRLEVLAIIEESNSILAEINDELMIRVSREIDNKLVVGDKTATLVTRLSFKDVPLEVAKKFRAVKKVVDPSVLKPLYEKGVNIPNVTSSEYILVRGGSK